MKFAAVCCITLGVLAGCSHKAPDQFSEDKPLYEYAMSRYDAGQYTDSVPYFESLRNRFPRSPYVVEAELKIGDAYFGMREYASAEASYRTFRSLHPSDENIPYVVFRMGMTHIKRMPTTEDRDQTHARNAAMILEELVSQYPNAKEIPEAQENVKKAKLMLAKQQLYIANFYLKQRQYSAALVRLRVLYGNTDFENLQIEAAYKLGYAHYKLKEPDEARKYLGEVSQNSKAGKYQKKAARLLKKLTT